MCLGLLFRFRSAGPIASTRTDSAYPSARAALLADVAASLREALYDRYTLERELGRGGMATVFFADDVRHRRRVALKVLSPELSYAVGADRFVREI
jgi:serine/threonine protein kinase